LFLPEKLFLSVRRPYRSPSPVGANRLGTTASRHAPATYGKQTKKAALISDVGYLKVKCSIL